MARGARPPLGDRLAAALARSLDRIAPAPGTWLVAVSGGADSTALLELLHAAAPPRGLRLVVAHVEHGIQPASGDAARLVTAQAARLGLAIELGALALGPGTGETRARDARRHWLLETQARRAAHGIFLAHQADDQAETVLMRLLHGSGPAGLAAMAEREGPWARPLLRVPRRALVRWLRQRGVPWWEDPANADPRHLRSWLRGQILPELRARLPQVDRHLRRAAAAARRDRAAWDQLLNTLPSLALSADPAGISFAATALLPYDSALRHALLAALGRRVGCRLGGAARKRLLRLLGSEGEARVADLADGWFAERSMGRIILRRRDEPALEEVALGPPGSLAWGAWCVQVGVEAAGERRERAAWRAWLPRDAALSLRPLRPGDRLRPLGGAGRRLAVRLLQEARIPRADRRRWPVVCADGEPVWIPGVCRAESPEPRPGEEALRIDVRPARS